MPWQRVSPRSRSRSISKEPEITLSKDGKIRWNQPTHDALELPTDGSDCWVEIYVDTEAGFIGVALSDTDRNAAKVYKHPKQNTYSISCVGVLRDFGILPSTAFRRSAQQEGPVLYIDVNELLHPERMESEDE